MIPNIANAEDEIGGELMLDFKAPVLDHSGPAIAGPGETGSALKIAIQQGRILVKRWWRKGGEPGIERTLPSHRHWGEAVWRREGRMDRGAEIGRASCREKGKESEV